MMGAGVVKAVNVEEYMPAFLFFGYGVRYCLGNVQSYKEHTIKHKPIKHIFSQYTYIFSVHTMC